MKIRSFKNYFKNGSWNISSCISSCSVFPSSYLDQAPQLTRAYLNHMVMQHLHWSGASACQVSEQPQRSFAHSMILFPRHFQSTLPLLSTFRSYRLQLPFHSRSYRQACIARISRTRWQCKNSCCPAYFFPFLFSSLLLCPLIRPLYLTSLPCLS